MTIEKRTVETATCDACGNVQCADLSGEFTSGFELTVKDYAEGNIHDVWSCKETHAGNAIRAVLARSRAQVKDEARWAEAEATRHEGRATTKDVTQDDDRELSATPVASER